MRQFLAVVIFSLATIGFFAAYSNYGIPQIEPAPPPKEEKIDLTSMTMDQFVALGGRLFNGKGTCKLCHNKLGRAPELGTIAEVAKERLKDPNYGGGASTVAEYLSESLTEPSAYVVTGFGKKGTGDKESPMPNVAAGSIRLSETEVTAVVAYLQESSGAEVTVEIPKDAAQDEGDDDEEEAEPREALSDPKALITLFSCTACHMISGEGGDAGPDLTTIGASRDRTYLRRALLEPNADIAKGFEPDAMPDDLGEQMYVSELNVLLDYLAGLK